MLLIWKWRSLLLRKNHLLRWWCCLFLLKWVGALTLSLLLKLPQRKVEHWFTLYSFLLLSLLCISINLPYGLTWNRVVMHGLVLVAATWKCSVSYKNRYIGLLVFHLLPLLKPLGHRRNVSSLSLFYRYYFCRPLSELTQKVPLPYTRRKSTRYSDRLHDFSVTIPRFYKDVYANSFFPRTAKLWISLPVECSHLTYDLINRHLLSAGSF